MPNLIRQFKGAVIDKKSSKQIAREEEEKIRARDQNRRQNEISARQAGKAEVTGGYDPQSMETGPGREPRTVAPFDPVGQVSMPDYQDFQQRQLEGPRPPPKEPFPSAAPPAYTAYSSNTDGTPKPTSHGVESGAALAQQSLTTSSVPVYSTYSETRAARASNQTSSRYSTDVVIASRSVTKYERPVYSDGTETVAVAKAMHGRQEGTAQLSSNDRVTSPRPLSAHQRLPSSHSDQSDLIAESGRSAEVTSQERGHLRLDFGGPFELGDTDVSDVERLDRRQQGSQSHGPQNSGRMLGSQESNKHPSRKNGAHENVPEDQCPEPGVARGKKGKQQRSHVSQTTPSAINVSSVESVKNPDDARNDVSTDRMKRESSDRAIINQDVLVESHAEAVEILRAQKASADELAKDKQASLDVLNSKYIALQANKVDLETQLKTQKNLATHAEGDLKTCQDNLKGCSEKLGTANKNLAGVLKDLDSSEKTKSGYVEMLTKANKKINAWATKYTELEQAHVEELNDLRSGHAQEMSLATQAYTADKDALRLRLENAQHDAQIQARKLSDSYTRELERLNREHDQKTSKMGEGYDKRIAELEQELEASKSSHAQVLDRAERSRRTEMLELQQTLQREIDLLEQKLRSFELEKEEEINHLTTIHNQQSKKLMKEYTATLAQKQVDLEQTRKNAELLLAEQKTTLKKELADQQSNHKLQTHEIREENRRLKEALLNRDDDLHKGAIFSTAGLPAQTDDRIYARFSGLQQLIDGLGRLQWKKKSSIWTDEVLDQVRGKIVDRVLKKAIVQDLLWCLLYHYFLCSPFRAFSGVGRALEREWSQACGQSDEPEIEFYEWPAPGALVERWRYMTIKECRDALRPPAPSDWDPRTPLRQGFEQSLSEFETAAQTALGNLIDLTTADIETIRKLARKTATIWLEFAAHRCRIVINLKGGESPDLQTKVTMATRSPIELTIVPEVGRYGDKVGADLENYTVIDRCTGKSLVLSP